MQFLWILFVIFEFVFGLNLNAVLWYASKFADDFGGDWKYVSNSAMVH